MIHMTPFSKGFYHLDVFLKLNPRKYVHTCYFWDILARSNKTIQYRSASTSNIPIGNLTCPWLLAEQKCIYESLTVISFTTIAIVKEVYSGMDDYNPGSIYLFFNCNIHQRR